jgi:hypothetical protein
VPFSGDEDELQTQLEPMGDPEAVAGDRGSVALNFNMKRTVGIRVGTVRGKRHILNLFLSTFPKLLILKPF